MIGKLERAIPKAIDAKHMATLSAAYRRCCSPARRPQVRKDLPWPPKSDISAWRNALLLVG